MDLATPFSKASSPLLSPIRESSLSLNSAASSYFPELLKNTSQSSPGSEVPHTRSNFSFTLREFVHESEEIKTEILNIRSVKPPLEIVEIPKIAGFDASERRESSSCWDSVADLLKDYGLKSVEFALIEEKDWPEVVADIVRQSGMRKTEMRAVEEQLAAETKRAEKYCREAQTLAAKLQATEELLAQVKRSLRECENRLASEERLHEKAGKQHRLEEILEKLYDENIALKAQKYHRKEVSAVPEPHNSDSPDLQKTLESVFNVKGAAEVCKAANAAALVLKGVPPLQRFVSKVIAAVHPTPPSDLADPSLFHSAFAIIQRLVSTHTHSKAIKSRLFRLYPDTKSVTVIVIPTQLDRLEALVSERNHTVGIPTDQGLSDLAEGPTLRREALVQ